MNHFHSFTDCQHFNVTQCIFYQLIARGIGVAETEIDVVNGPVLTESSWIYPLLFQRLSALKAEVRAIRFGGDVCLEPDNRFQMLDDGPIQGIAITGVIGQLLHHKCIPVLPIIFHRQLTP